MRASFVAINEIAQVLTTCDEFRLEHHGKMCVVSQQRSAYSPALDAMTPARGKLGGTGRRGESPQHSRAI